MSARDAGPSVGPEGWAFNASGEVQHLAFAGGILVGTGQGFVVALDAATGQPLWAESIPSAAGFAPAIGGGLVFVMAGPSSVAALNLSSGRQVWNYTTPDHECCYGGAQALARSSPVVYGNQVTFGTSGPTVFSLDIRTGREVWRHSQAKHTRPSIFGPDYPDVTGYNDTIGPATAIPGELLITTTSGQPMSLDPATGRLLWRYEFYYGAFTPPAVEDGTLVIGRKSNADNLASLHLGNRSERWTTNVGDSLLHPPVVDRGVVFIYGSDLVVRALDGDTGEYRWPPIFTSSPTRCRPCHFDNSAPALHDGKMFVAGANQVLYALNATDGLFLGSFDLGGDTYTTPIVANGVVYVGAGNRVLAVPLEKIVR